VHSHKNAVSSPPPIEKRHLNDSTLSYYEYIFVIFLYI